MNKVFQNKDHVYLIGIGGIGMSALARFFKLDGRHVCGYDKTPSALTDKLVSEGIPVHFEDDSSLIPIEYQNPVNTLLIYTPAIPKDHVEFNFLKNKGLEPLKRAAVLGEISSFYNTLAISGTHGKTTTSSILTHLLKSANRKILGFVGGINMNNDSNVIIDEDAQYLITEADEYDKSFLTLNPNYLLITSIDADHLDIYGSPESVIDTYKELATQVKSNGKIVVHADIKDHFRQFPVLSYGIESGNNKISNISIVDGKYEFSMTLDSTEIEKLTFQLPGNHNLLNALGASSIAKMIGLSSEEIRAGLSSFKGVKRRFEVRYRSEKLIYIDDYAHHPKEISSCLNAARSFYPEKKITVLFQPHLYSRTRDFMQEFADELSQADQVLLLGIYPAREKPIEGISSQVLLDRIQNPNKKLVKKEEIIPIISEIRTGVVITMGAGDIDRLVEPITNKIKNQ